MWTLLTALLWGCDVDREPPVPPEIAMVEVTRALSVCAHGGDAGREAWARAHDRYERSIEPALREVSDPRSVLRLEYGFAELHQVLDDPDEADLRQAELVRTLDGLMNRLPPQVAQR